MPGFTFADRPGGLRNDPNMVYPIMANLMSGSAYAGSYGSFTQLPQINAGDLIVLTTKSTLTSGGNVVARPLVAGDVTNLYQINTPTTSVAGIYGVAADMGATNATGGLFGVNYSLGGVNYALQNTSGGIGLDPATGRAYLPVQLARPDQSFYARLYTGSTGYTLQSQYNNTLAGINISLTDGVSTYTVDPGATTKCIEILGPVFNDVLYNVAVAQNAQGPLVRCAFIGAFSQSLTGFNYTAQ